MRGFDEDWLPQGYNKLVKISYISKPITSYLLPITGYYRAIMLHLNYQCATH